MPLYEYRCKQCGHVFEKIQSYSAPDAPCPRCAGEVERLLSAPAIQFKGSGFYLTDYGKSGAAPKAGGSDSGSSSSGDSGKSSSDAGKSAPTSSSAGGDGSSSSSSSTQSNSSGSSPSSPSSSSGSSSST